MNKTGTDPTPISWTSSVAFQNSNTNTSPRSSPVKQISEMTQSPWDSKSSVSIRKTITEGTRHPITSVKNLAKNLFSEPNSSPDSTSEENISELVNTTPYWETTFGQEISKVHQNPTTKTELESTTVLTTTTKPLGEGMDKSDDNTTLKPKSKTESLPKLKTTPVQTTAWPTQRPTVSSNVSKMNQTAIFDQGPKQNQKIKKPGTGLNIKTFSKSKTGQPPKTISKLKPPRPGQKPHPGFTHIRDKIHKAQTNKTSKLKPPFRFRPPTRPTLEPPAETIQKLDPAVQPDPKLKIKSGAAPTQSSWTSTKIQTMSTTMQSTLGFVKKLAEETPSPLDNNPNVSFKKTITEQPKNLITSTEMSNENLLPEPNSNPYTTSEEKRSQLLTSTAHWDIKPTQKTSTVHQNPKISKKWEFGASPITTPKPLEESREVSGDNFLHEPKSKEESEPKPTPTSVQTTAWPTQRPAVSRNISKLNQTAKLGQAPKRNPTFQKPGTGLNTKPNKNQKPGQPPKTISKLKPPRPGQKPHTGFTPIRDKFHKAQTNKTSKLKPPFRFRPPTRP
ncbi:mucin-5AC, partial [Oryzias melastigma]|uniref:mucin-5AC n=1 Tax=Oryzias melastigma TaxID=30732 RepID=UPI000CF7EBED